jgi:uncharacterized protein YkwD
MLPTRRILAVLVFALCLGASTATAPAAIAATCAPDPSWGTNRPDLAQRVVELVNKHRAGKGLRPFAVSAPLTAAAEWKSLHMAGLGYFAHDDPAPVSRSAFQRTQDCGYRGTTWAENIAYGYPTAEAVVAGWLASPGHRANIERASLTAIGVGAGSRGGRLYWTQSFGNDASGSPPATAPPRRGIAGGVARITRAGSKLTARVVFVDLSTGKTVTGGRVRCRATVSGRPLRVLASAFSAGAARCAWHVPPGATGQELTGVVRLQAGAAAASRLFVRVVR